MKKLTTLIAAAVLATSAGLAQARDVNPDEAVRLISAGTIQNFEQLNSIVLAQHPNATIRDTELEEKNGRYIYEVEIRDASGVEWDLELDATNGTILKNKRDD